uniref:GHMP kinase N-terminal domain-containing protein n=1 Tax=Meloidogyne floridensis TaxID=298350 RepID=A0A915P227_9BILA
MQQKAAFCRRECEPEPKEINQQPSASSGQLPPSLPPITIPQPSNSFSARQVKPQIKTNVAVAFSECSSAQNSPTSACSSTGYCPSFRHPGVKSAARSVAATSQSPMRSLSSASGGLYLSAPGKIILFGEHAVVYGRTAIAGSIDLRTYLSLFTSADGRIYLCLPDMNIEKTWLLKDLQREISKLPNDLFLLAEEPPSLELVVPIAKKLSGASEEQSGVQNLAILAFWYLLIGVVIRRRFVYFLFASGFRPFYVSDDASCSLPQTDGSKTCQMQDPKTKSVKQPLSVWYVMRWDLLAVKVTVRFKLPSCVGLGSSGAYCVCIATALLQTAGLIPPSCVPTDSEDSSTWDEQHLDMIRKWSSAAESLIHGRASGLDAAICTYGGIASYMPGKRLENLQNIPDLKVILVNSRVERNTSRMVQTVKDNYKKYPAVVEPIFDTIDALAYEAAKILQRQFFLLNTTDRGGGENGSSLENGGRSAALSPQITLTDGPDFACNSVGSHHQKNLQPSSSCAAGSGGGRSPSLGGGSYAAGGKRGSNASAISGVSAGTTRIERSELTDTFDRLNELCRINNQLLIALGVGHAKVDQISTLLGRYGIYPKMTGAGGGGCLYAFLKPETSQTLLNMIKDELRKDGYEMWQPALGGPGVLQHQNKPELFASASNSSSASSTGRGSSSSAAVPVYGGISSRSNTPASSHQSTPAVRHKK